MIDMCIYSKCEKETWNKWSSKRIVGDNLKWMNRVACCESCALKWWDED